ncbi:hypothetical protein FQN49_002324 [Arthroderma sp. PD_2]|nr:hypothetical protein FQN49_002324 [Arthroderma sp. PD_2]
MDNHAFAQAISQGLGWAYFLLWSLSFYPQLIHNYRRRSTDGFSFDFSILNVLGLASYTVFNGCLFLSPVVRAQYAKRHPQSPEPTVQLNDFVYALHGAIVCLLIYSQFKWTAIWRFKSDSLQKEPKASTLTLALLWGSLGTVALDAAGVIFFPTWTRREWLDVVYTIGSIKVFLTAVKYTPQVVMNFYYQSTEGFSIVAILLDFTGALLSLMQLILDSSLQADWSGTLGNLSKLLLGNITMLFDVVFFIQHYCLYRKRRLQTVYRKAEDCEEDPLLGPRSTEHLPSNPARPLGGEPHLGHSPRYP